MVRALLRRLLGWSGDGSAESQSGDADAAGPDADASAPDGDDAPPDEDTGAPDEDAEADDDAGAVWDLIPSWQYGGRHVESGGVTRDEQERALEDIQRQADAIEAGEDLADAEHLDER